MIATKTLGHLKLGMGKEMYAQFRRQFAISTTHFQYLIRMCCIVYHLELQHLQKLKGKAAMQKFVHERLDKKSVKFHDPLPKMDVKNFASMAITKTMTSSDKKTKEITATRNVFGQLAVLALNHNICLEKALSYPLSPVPWSMATADGLPTKTKKAVFQDHISRTHTLTSLPKGEKAFIIDGNATLHQQVTIPDTFGALAENVFNTLPIQKHTRIDFVTDSPRLRSIKDLTRKSVELEKVRNF